jgi:hypothetical protein
MDVRSTARRRAETALGAVALASATAGALTTGACRDAATPEPVVDTARPVFDTVTVTTGDSTAVVEWAASDDQRLITFDYYLSRARYTQGVLTGLDLIKHETIPLPPERRARFRLVTPPLPPSSGYLLQLEAHDAAGRAAYWGGYVAIGPATPTARLRAVGGDTVRGLAVLLDASILGRHRIVQTELIRGDGTLLRWDPDSTADASMSYAATGETPRAGTLLLPLAPPGSAPTNGPVRVTLRAIDDSGRVGVDSVTLVHLLPDAPYAVTPLGPAGSQDSDARDLDDRGDVVGTVTNAAGTIGVVWRGGRPAPEPLAAPGDSVADPAAINERGEVAGTLRAQSAPQCGRATIWSAAGVPRSAAPTNPPCSLLVDINDRGDALGLQVTTVNPVFVTRGDALEPVLSLAAPTPRAIGNSGLAVGNEMFTFGLPRRTHTDAVAWLPGRLVLPCLARLALPSEGCRAVDVNELGQILGSAAGMPILWQPGPRLVPLAPALYGTQPVGLDDRGHVLAYREADSTAFVLRDSAVVRVRVTDPSWAVDRVTAMNAVGQIIGHGVQRATGRRSALLLTPVR